MKTEHRIIFSSAGKMEGLENKSIDLVVTSPPYPMIEMWDEIICSQSSEARKRKKDGDGPGMFEAMHRVLDPVWRELYRVLKPGGIACINIGDATRTINDVFSVYTNHSRILQTMISLGFSPLPCILWRKQTNAPNKFMGSGMLPAGAYVTLEHEYILILRKGAKREFKTSREKKNRRESAMFWEERNVWFSDVWMDIKGALQDMGDKTTRKRSGAFPFELAYRLISMYSVKGDMVLDPFLGTGTTMQAAVTAGRNSVGYEVDPLLEVLIQTGVEEAGGVSRSIIERRLLDHVEFVRKRIETKGPLKHKNIHYGFPVVTAQEKELLINELTDVKILGPKRFEALYGTEPGLKFEVDEFKGSRSPSVKFGQYSLF